MNYIHSKKGFSLIEIMVSLAIFSIVVVVATGALLSIIDANRKAHATKTIVNNLNFALESMSREMRVGSNFHCVQNGSFLYIVAVGKNCPDGSSYIVFKNAENKDIAYGLDEGVLYRMEGQNTATFKIVPVTSPEVILNDNLDNLMFYVTGAEVDNKQPKIHIIFQGEIGEKDKEKTFLNLQTTVSQRATDL